VRIELADVGGRHADVERRLRLGAGADQDECRGSGAEKSIHACYLDGP
jgi:hypothetical protein